MEFIKGGFPKLLLKEYSEKNTKKPIKTREFSNKNIISIDDILNAKVAKDDLLIDVSLFNKESKKVTNDNEDDNTKIIKFKPQKVKTLLNRIDKINIKSKKVKSKK